MTQEDKARAYDKVVNKLKGFMAQGVDPLITRANVQDFFHELKESVDERIRKDCIKYLDWEYQHCPLDKDKMKIEKCIAWLEKQCEQNLTDKVEPKFKVGDWVIVSTSDKEKVVQIDSIEYFKSGEPKYITSEGRWFGSGTKARLWTIQDANDGDVLYSPSHRLIWIYKDNERYHTSINLNYANVVSFDNEIVFPSDVCPANRVQKSILFQKMEEAGYEWDAEKKELKKIEQKSATMSLDEAIKHCKEKSCGNNACALEHKQLEKWLTELKELKEQNPAWSEEDEHIINKILCICNDFKRSFEISPASTKVVQNDIDKIDSWLESLRHRNTWKPSDEQMERLKGVINSLPHQEVLYSLYQDLLKLKE